MRAPAAGRVAQRERGGEDYDDVLTDEQRALYRAYRGTAKALEEVEPGDNESYDEAEKEEVRRALADME